MFVSLSCKSTHTFTQTPVIHLPMQLTTHPFTYIYPNTCHPFTHTTDYSSIYLHLPKHLVIHLPMQLTTHPFTYIYPNTLSSIYPYARRKQSQSFHNFSVKLSQKFS